MAKTKNADSAILPLKADDSLKTTTALYKCAYIKSSMTGALCSTANDKAVGMVSAPMSEGSDYVSVIHEGMAKGAMLSLTVASAGDWLVPAAGGFLNAFTTNTSAQTIVGQALETSRTGGAVTLLVKIQKYGVLD